MTRDEFLSFAKSRGAKIWQPQSSYNHEIVNTILQNHKFAMLPTFINEFYKTIGAINIGNAYIFGPNEISRGAIAPIPAITQINQDFQNISALYGKTIFARNDLFIFAFDAFGTCLMLDNLDLHVLRKYDDPYRAMTDCIMSGNF